MKAVTFQIHVRQVQDSILLVSIKSQIKEFTKELEVYSKPKVKISCEVYARYW